MGCASVARCHGHLFCGRCCVLVVVSDAGRLREAERLLAEVSSWGEEEVEELPELYRRRAEEFRGLVNRGEGEGSSSLED